MNLTIDDDDVTLDVRRNPIGVYVPEKLYWESDDGTEKMTVINQNNWMTKDKAIEIIKELGAVYVQSERPHKYKDVEVIEAIDKMIDTIDQLHKARKKARRYKKLFISEKIVKNKEKNDD
jgi:hypothetical protein